MIAVSVSCVAIAKAVKSGTIRKIERTSRFGGTFIAIEDDHGIIEVADDMAEADARIAAVSERMQ